MSDKFDRAAVIRSIMGLAALLRDWYHDKKLGRAASLALGKYIKSPAFTHMCERADVYTCARKLACIVDTVIDDAHFNIGIGNPRGLSGAIISRCTPHYIRIFDFAHTDSEAVRNAYIGAFAQFRDPLVIDIRGSGGGSLELTYFILCHLFDDGVQLFRVQSRNSTNIFKSVSAFTQYNTYNRIKKYMGRVRVLVSGDTASAAETLAGVIKYRKRGDIYGTATAASRSMTNTMQIGIFTVIMPYARVIFTDHVLRPSIDRVIPDFLPESREYINLIYTEVVENVSVTPVE